MSKASVRAKAEKVRDLRIARWLRERGLKAGTFGNPIPRRLIRKGVWPVADFLMSEGYPRNKAFAIAYREARKAGVVPERRNPMAKSAAQKHAQANAKRAMELKKSRDISLKAAWAIVRGGKAKGGSKKKAGGKGKKKGRVSAKKKAAGMKLAHFQKLRAKGFTKTDAKRIAWGKGGGKKAGSGKLKPARRLTMKQGEEQQRETNVDREANEWLAGLPLSSSARSSTELSARQRFERSARQRHLAGTFNAERDRSLRELAMQNPRGVPKSRTGKKKQKENGRKLAHFQKLRRQGFTKAEAKLRAWGGRGAAKSAKRVEKFAKKTRKLAVSPARRAAGKRLARFNELAKKIGKREAKLRVWDGKKGHGGKGKGGKSPKKNPVTPVFAYMNGTSAKSTFVRFDRLPREIQKRLRKHVKAALRKAGCGSVAVGKCRLKVVPGGKGGFKVESGTCRGA